MAHDHKSDDARFLVEQFGIAPHAAANLLLEDQDEADELARQLMAEEHNADPLAGVPAPAWGRDPEHEEKSIRELTSLSTKTHQIDAKEDAMTPVPTTEELRAKIDSGVTGEKVGFPDPATVPLGTDDEAAGHTPTVEERRMAAASQPRFRRPLPRNGPLLYAAIIAVVVALLWVVAVSV